MSYNAIMKAYLKALQNQYKNAINSGQYTAELSYRMPLDAMEKALVQKFLNKWTIFLFCSILFSSNQKEH